MGTHHFTTQDTKSTKLAPGFAGVFGFFVAAWLKSLSQSCVLRFSTSTSATIPPSRVDVNALASGSQDLLCFGLSQPAQPSRLHARILRVGSEGVQIEPRGSAIALCRIYPPFIFRSIRSFGRQCRHRSTRKHFGDRDWWR